MGRVMQGLTGWLNGAVKLSWRHNQTQTAHKHRRQLQIRDNAASIAAYCVVMPRLNAGA
jgi:hypothetical protein